MPTTRQCGECGTPLPDELPDGACPVCALRGALEPPEDASDAAVTEQAGDRIGRYKLLEKIGEGGYGVVYMAEQAEPIRRRVALKVVKLGMDTKQVIARFEAERQALALMDHPNIARVLDAGATETGRPYFVMELVRGTKITDYCDQHHLSTRERLDLFIRVCQAVQHAHQKGIIHRDLKPSNILVTRLDGVAVPKVIDFGIAKATQQPLTEKTLFTAFQQFVGTPAYMSPEQAEMSGADLDTRSDIYALGVLLYELVTGQTPFDNSEFKRASLDELRRLIREKEPLRPSTRLRTLPPDALITVARRRRTEPTRLIHLMRGDVNWIVMKCLEKDRTRRYETASGLAHDIERHLNHEPVTTAGPSALYRLGKFARRHVFGLVMAHFVAIIIVAGVIVGSCEALRANRMERLAETRLRGEQEASQKAQEKRREAEAALDEANGQRARAQDSLAKAELEKSEKERALKQADEQKLQAEAARDQAKADRDKAQQDRDRAEIALQEADHARQAATNATITANNALRASREQQAKLEETMGFMLFDLSDKLWSIGHVDLLREVTENVLAHYQSLPLADEAGESLPRRLRAMQNLGHALTIMGESGKGEAAYRRSLEMAEKLSHGDPANTNWLEALFTCHEQIGNILQARGDSARALQEFGATLAIAQRLATNHLSTPLGRRGLAQSYIRVGDARSVLADKTGASSAYSSALRTAQQLTSTDTNNAAWQMDLSACYAKLGALGLEEGEVETATTQCQTSLEIAQRCAATDTSNLEWQSALADRHEGLGDVLARKAGKELLEAQDHYEEALRIRQALAQTDPGNTRWQRDLLRTRFNLARAQAVQSQGSKQLKAFLAGWEPVVKLTKMPVDVGYELFATDNTSRKSLETVQQAMQDARQLAEKDPANMQWREDLASYHSLVGDMLLLARQPQEALNAYREALNIRVELAGRLTNAAPVQHGLALSHANAAVALRRLSLTDQALAEARQALDLLGDLGARWPGNSFLTEGPRAREGNLRPKLPISPDQRRDFRAAFMQGFDRIQTSGTTDPKNAEQWACYCSERAVLALFFDEVGRAVDYQQKAVLVWQSMLRAAPASPERQARLMRACLALAVLQLLNHQPQETIRTCQLALPLAPARTDLHALLAMGYYCSNQEGKALDILLEHKDLKVNPWQTFGDAVLEDLARLREKGLTQLDPARIKQRLAARAKE